VWSSSVRATPLLLASLAAVAAVGLATAPDAPASERPEVAVSAVPAVEVPTARTPAPADPATALVVVGPPAGEATTARPAVGVAGQQLQDAIARGEVPPPRRTRAALQVAEAGPPASVDPAVVTAEGFHVVPGTAGAGAGPTVTYTVEVEPVLGADLLAVAATVDEALHDPRSWARDHRLERIEDPDVAQIRVLLATPATVDQLCLAVGLDTAGRYSCWTGRFAALNADRWEHGAADFDDLTTYRRYLVNHEVGHGLGHGHVDCPASGVTAPVMMQQSITTGACVANGWPYPDEDLG
jgi:hypothetical protein